MIDGLKILLPFPYIVGKEMYNGCLLAWPDFCVKSCKTKKCFEANNVVSLCSYGFNYVKYGQFIFGGIILQRSADNEQRRKLIKRKNTIIPNSLLETLKSTVKSFESSIEDEIMKHKKEILDRYIEEDVYKSEFIESIKKDMLKGFSYVHDYKQINSTIRQNINIIIEEKYTGNNFEEKLKKASIEELAIYKASDILTEKLKIAKFLINQEWLLDYSLCINNKFYRIVHKYMRMYDNRAKIKNVNVKIVGRSHNEIFANPEAISVIPHTLLDNAIKYAPKNSEILITINDVDRNIEFNVSSYGPKILDEEIEKVFHPFFRGKNAKAMEEEGAGYGLYVCQLIAIQHFNTRISVFQDSFAKDRMGHKTVFSITIPNKAFICDY